MQKNVSQIVQSYLGMTPKDKGCSNWTEMQSKMEEELSVLFTDEQVQKIVRDTISSTAQGVKKWVDCETVAIDKTTKKPIVNCELTVIDNAKPLKDYIYLELREKGINLISQ